MSARWLHVERQGLRLPVLDDGPLAGPAVLCLHGFPQDGTAFDEVRQRLSAAGSRVLVPHQRGYAPSARPPGRAAYALPELVHDALAVLDAAEVRAAHVVGHDWGGALAWALAARHRERVSGLTVLSTPHPRAMVAAALRGQALRSAYIGLFQLPLLPEAVALRDDAAVMRAALSGSGLPADAVQRYVSRLQEPRALRSALAWYRALPLGSAYGVGTVRVPTTYMWGAKDPFFAKASVLSTGNWVAAPFRSIGLRAGHWLPENRGVEVADQVLEGMARRKAVPSRRRVG
jgi:pimeloyl-ACP methyl ester carboxylesterase